MILFTLLIAFAFLALTVILVIAILNAITFPRLRVPPPSTAPLIHPSADTPLVSILIPARNEASVIANTLRTLRAQTYTPFEIILLDDQSTDGTAEIARAAAQGDPRVQIIAGQPLLEGWLGKNWACHQLSNEAHGRVLIFTDADVQWQPDALKSLVAMMGRTQADLLTVWPTQITVTRSERLVVPLIALAIFGYLPALLVQKTPFPALAAANGQCLAFKKAAYNAVGGHVAVRTSIIEDISFARRIKAKGLQLVMADGAGLITCRMYRSWREVRDGFAKNILAGYGGRVSALTLATIFHWLIFVLPWLWLLFGELLPQIGGWPVLPLLLVLLGVGVRGLTAGATRQRITDALWMPVSALLMTVIAAQSVWWQWRFGGAIWKGRTFKNVR
ncbi:MAG: glycosyltransferase [Chloroflexi bacterium]|nr:glycosyltransferase [Chloroflexota bacterium]